MSEYAAKEITKMLYGIIGLAMNESEIDESIIYDRVSDTTIELQHPDTKEWLVIEVRYKDAN